MAEKKPRCWPGYEPVPGKRPYSKGSCRPKAASKLTAAEKAFREKREKQLEGWQAEHPDSPRSAAQHLRGPDTPKAKRSSGTRKSAAKKASKRTAPKRARTTATAGRKSTRGTGGTVGRETAAKRPAKSAARKKSAGAARSRSGSTQPSARAHRKSTRRAAS